MADEIYGVDPDILNNSTLIPRSAPAAGIGFGTPRQFTFQHGQPLDSSLWTTKITGNWTVEPNDGFLRFQGVPWSNSTMATINPSFSLNLASVTFAFKIRVNQISQLASGFALQFTYGLGLNWGPNSTSPAYFNPDTGERLGASQIQPDGKWHTIVINVQPAVIIIWEDDRHVVTWPPATILTDRTDLWFGFTANESADPNPPNTAATSIDISDITFLVGTTQQTRLRLAGVTQSQFETTLPYVRSLGRYIPDVVTAAKPLTDIISGIDVGPSSIFFGKDPGPAAAAAVQRLKEDPALTRLTNAAVTGPSAVHPVIYIAGTTNLSFFISGGVSIGVLIGTGSNRYSLFALTLNGGVVTNVGAQVVVDVGIFLHQEPRGLLGRGCYMQIGAGEIIQGSLGISGNFPPHLDTWDNCGAALSLGVGLSVSSVDIAAGLSYTWEMGQL